MGNPNQHASDPLPLLAVGGGVGRGNRHIRLAPRTPIGNLWVSVANHYGSPIETLGESNGRVELFTNVERKTERKETERAGWAGLGQDKISMKRRAWLVAVCGSERRRFHRRRGRCRESGA